MSTCVTRYHPTPTKESHSFSSLPTKKQHFTKNRPKKKEFRPKKKVEFEPKTAIHVKFCQEPQDFAEEKVKSHIVIDEEYLDDSDFNLHKKFFYLCRRTEFDHNELEQLPHKRKTTVRWILKLDCQKKMEQHQCDVIGWIEVTGFQNITKILRDKGFLQKKELLYHKFHSFMHFRTARIILKENSKIRHEVCGWQDRTDLENQDLCFQAYAVSKYDGGYIWGVGSKAEFAETKMQAILYCQQPKTHSKLFGSTVGEAIKEAAMDSHKMYTKWESFLQLEKDMDNGIVHSSDGEECSAPEDFTPDPRDLL